jgi:hypothetical protein
MLTTTLTLAIATALGNSPVAPATDIPPLPMEVLGGAQSPKLVIDRIKMIDNVDANILTADRADLYAIVIVNDVEYKTRIMAKDDGRPNWEIPLPTNASRVNVKIRLFDEDGGMEGGDDHIDISRAKDKKDLIFVYMPATGRVYGDINGRKGQSFYTRGLYDGDKAHFWFSVV